MKAGNDYRVRFFNFLKVFDSFFLHVFGSRIIADDEGVLVHLQDAYRPHLADAAFNSLADCLGFVFAVGDNHDFFRVSDGADPDGQRCLGDEVDVIVEKTGVGFYGIHGRF